MHQCFLSDSSTEKLDLIILSLFQVIQLHAECRIQLLTENRDFYSSPPQDLIDRPNIHTNLLPPQDRLPRVSSHLMPTPIPPKINPKQRAAHPRPNSHTQPTPLTIQNPPLAPLPPTSRPSHASHERKPRRAPDEVVAGAEEGEEARAPVEPLRLVLEVVVVREEVVVHAVADGREGVHGRVGREALQLLGAAADALCHGVCWEPGCLALALVLVV